MRIFVFLNGDEVAAFEATHIPRVGETVWCRTLDGEWSLVVNEVEHQFDKSKADTYSSHDVSLYCSEKPKSSGE